MYVYVMFVVVYYMHDCAAYTYLYDGEQYMLLDELRCSPLFCGTVLLCWAKGSTRAECFHRIFAVLHVCKLMQNPNPATDACIRARVHS